MQPDLKINDPKRPPVRQIISAIVWDLTPVNQQFRKQIRENLFKVYLINRE